MTTARCWQTPGWIWPPEFPLGTADRPGRFSRCADRCATHGNAGVLSICDGHDDPGIAVNSPRFHALKVLDSVRSDSAARGAGICSCGW